jgi:hypothetical protein
MDKHAKESDVHIASAFFTRYQYLEELVKNGCHVRLVVRLGYPTNAFALRKAFLLPNVSVRYFTSTKFHPKLYIFNRDIAFIGSSNLTESGLFENNELNMSVDSTHPDFTRILDIFDEYWDNASPLDRTTLDNYEEATKGMENANKEYEEKMKKTIPAVEMPNYSSQNKPTKRQSMRVDAIKREYQLFLEAFKHLENEYRSLNVRLTPESVLPLRLEIHRFMNYIKDVPMRDQKSKAENAPVRKGEELSRFVREQISKFHRDNSEGHHDLTVQIDKFTKLKASFSSKDSIKNLDASAMLENLLLVNAFKESVSSSGKINNAHDFFYKHNDVERVKRSLTYLLFGKGEFTTRVANCIHLDEYKIHEFGNSSMKEFYGWLNPDGVPLYNNRVSTSMQWLGYGQL